MNKIIKRLSDLLLWSDRLGSDERNEIQEIIKDCKVIQRICEIQIETGNLSETLKKLKNETN
jgi:hypothetical protein